MISGVEINIFNLLAHRTSAIYILLARPNFHWPAYKMLKQSLFQYSIHAP